MQISKIKANKQSFKSLYINQKLTNKLANPLTSKNFLSDFATIKDYIFTSKLDNKKFVDVILSEKNDKFYALISSKEQGVPINPSNELVIDTTKKDLSKFKKWVNEWNHAYNPRTLKQFQKLDELIKQKDWTNTPLDKALKAIWK